MKECMICKKPLEKGIIIADNYVKALEINYSKSMDKQFIKTVIFEYAQQFDDFKTLNENSDLDQLFDIADKRFQYEDYRRHIKLFLVGHEQCIKTTTILKYEIRIEELIEKELSTQLSERNWYNPKGWKRILEYLK